MCMIFYKHPTESTWHYYKTYYSEEFAKSDVDMLITEGREVKQRLTSLEN